MFRVVIKDKTVQAKQYILCCSSYFRAWWSGRLPWSVR